MNKEEAWKVVDKWDGWNFDQESAEKLFGSGIPNDVDKIYDERRKLILKAHKVLNGDLDE